MTSPALLQRLTDLFRETGRAHHQAFLATDGDDPEWPLWYADFLLDRLKDLLAARFTRSELVYLLVWADRDHARQAPGADWPAFYARFFAERYGSWAGSLSS